MFGSGLLKGLGITLKHVRDTFTDDAQKTPSRYEGMMEQAANRRIIKQPLSQEGILTVQYPEEKRLLPERFRYIPMLLFDTETNEDRCTACGICAKVCPPQCIWIVRDMADGKPIPRPAEFFIDATVCMSCSFCVEFCPFDAIKMNHDYELATFERYPNLVYDKAELTVPLEYYAALWPTQYAEEQKRRAEEAEVERQRAEQKAAADAAKKAAAEAKAAAPAESGAPALSGADRAAELKRKAQEAAAARAAAAAQGGESAAAAEAAGDAVAAAPAAVAPAAVAADDAEAAAKKARIEEMKRKAQESAAKRKAESGE
jgi:NADH-quinone oxidoreductase subunit I